MFKIKRHRLRSRLALYLSRKAWQRPESTDWLRHRSQRMHVGTADADVMLNQAIANALTELRPRAVYRLTNASVALLFGGTLACTAAVAALAMNLAVHEEVHDRALWERRLESKLRVPVMDSANRPVGFDPGLRPERVAADAAIVPDNVPDHCIDLALASEDAHYQKPWQMWGVNLMALRFVLLKSRGGSTLPMQLSRILADWRRDLPDVERKAAELAAAKVIVDLHGGDYRAMAWTYLAIAPMAVAGGDVNGIAAFAEVMFRKSASQLDHAECAFAVAALPSPLLLTSQTDTATNFDKVLRRARALVVRTGIANVASEGLDRIEAAGLPVTSDFAGYKGRAVYSMTSRTELLVKPVYRWIQRDQSSGEGGP